jgi:DEAD/DEAH box helicase domain-containing protein
MDDFEDFLHYLKTQDSYSGQIKHVETIPEMKACYDDPEIPLHKRLQKYLQEQGITLWRHQAEALNHVRGGKNVITVTSTASGKSLIYNLAVLDSMLQDEYMTALYIFPTKALARDQYNALIKLLTETNIKSSRAGVYDGDIEANEKRLVLGNANIIITNPYGLHFYLPWFKQKWRRICQNLKYVVLDEVHIYRGIFGSNFAFLMRRLKRVLASYDVKPIWILSSATINNPREFCKKLVGEEFAVVDKDDSPSGLKKVLLWDLPYDDNSQKYRSSHQETKNLFINHLTYKEGLQTLTFTLSRKMAELQAIWIKKALPQMKDRICSYRAGISKRTRKEVEERFKRKEIMGISSTNALELGIDIGSLDATISSGFPGTISSFKQQIGRSGRGSSLSVSTLIPMQNPLDLFYVHNPDVLFGPIREETLITLKNPYIIKNHICCGAKETPVRIIDFKEFGVEDENYFAKCVEELVNEELLMKRGDKFFWKGEFFPNENYGLNDLSTKSYKIIELKPGKNEILTVEDESYVFRDLHPGAVYLYEAETYVVQELDLIDRIVYIKKKDVDYYTQSLKHTSINVLSVERSQTIGNDDSFTSAYGKVKVEHEYYAYKVVDSFTQEIVSKQPLEDLPIIEFETQALWFTIPFEDQKELEMNGYDLGGSINAIENAMIAIAPSLAQISRWDLGGVSIDFDPVKQQPIIYIYDAYKGGIGITELLYPNLEQLLALSFKLIETCQCKSEDGCPCCIMSPKCGNANQPLSRKGSLYLLEKLNEKMNKVTLSTS